MYLKPVHQLFWFNMKSNKINEYTFYIVYGFTTEFQCIFGQLYTSYSGLIRQNMQMLIIRLWYFSNNFIIS